MDIKSLSQRIRSFDGVSRKRDIGDIVKTLSGRDNLSFSHDDAAVLDGGRLLFASDGITEGLVNADPYFAGYCAVLVNVNDIAAMGGVPTAMVDVISAKDLKTALEIARGIREGSEKFGVPIVGGHFNPGSSYNSVVISVIGHTVEGRFINGSSASPGDEILVAVDLKGSLHPKYGLAWDSTTEKSPEEVRHNLNLLVELSGLEIVRCGRDISNPGLIGTLGMMLEGSGVGGRVELEKIPIPGGVNLEDWVMIYPGYGFVFTATSSKVPEVISFFKNAGISAASIGRVEKSPKLLIFWRGVEAEVFDFEKDSITGVRKW
jgi:putative methanogenesis marker protein 2